MNNWTSLYLTIGQNVREIRHLRHMNQGRLASLIGLNRTSITNLEKGRQRVPLDTLFDIAVVLQIPLSRLLPTDKVPESPLPFED